MIAWPVALAAAAMSFVGAGEPGWARFSRTSSVFRQNIQVNIGTLAYDRERRQLQYWMRRKESGSPDLLWADTVRCPQLRDTLGAMRYLGAEPGAPEAKRIALFLDDATYTLDTPGQSGPSGMGTTHMTSGAGTALARWVEDALEAMQPCWSPTAPARSVDP
ncbi:MAG: hypothetical protein JWR77_1303 [Rhizorhabdus sp.]|nr:hypothetical protein [Rhizorhabdus sp.]